MGPCIIGGFIGPGIIVGFVAGTIGLGGFIIGCGTYPPGPGMTCGIEGAYAIGLGGGTDPGIYPGAGGRIC